MTNWNTKRKESERANDQSDSTQIQLELDHRKYLLQHQIVVYGTLVQHQHQPFGLQS